MDELLQYSSSSGDEDSSESGQLPLKIRTFPHVEGDFAVHVFVSGLLTALRAVLSIGKAHDTARSTAVATPHRCCRRAEEPCAATQAAATRAAAA